MSKTDKTAPYWVHVMREGAEHHNHARHECNMDEFVPSASREKYYWFDCRLELGYRLGSQAWGRPEAFGKVARKNNQRKRRISREDMRAMRNDTDAWDDYADVTYKRSGCHCCY